MFLYPDLAARSLLQLPDRRDLLQLVNAPCAGSERLRPVLRPHHDQHNVLADVDLAIPVQDQDLDDIEILQRPLPDFPQRLLRHALIMLASHEADLSVALNGGSRVKDLVAVLQRSYPQISELIQKKTVLVAVNQEIAHEDTEIRDGDEVALLPPFAGGTAMGTNAPGDAMLVRV